ncbi:MAG TPA: bifunctional methylenetetrahydrofolate dehydrogenase/methenyltetrahydrofolate cyclohydrolase FolD [Nitrospiria bacterium]|nr:bifunctional methylenetetrahydrofolate dehydrogenase/methenyltetrahydrofolate cyclohydrolase FolD [Nitrospiria bacterium]
MTAQIIDGKLVAQTIRSSLTAEVMQLKARGVEPGLAAVLVGDNPASVIYVRNKRKACAEVGIVSTQHDLPATATQAQLLEVIGRLNDDPKVNGILVQLPLPKGISPEAITDALSPAKDVDGLHPYNIGRLTRGDSLFVPCTPLGCMELLDHYKLPVEGRRAVVIGRSNLVGKPAALLLMHRNATVTVCHSRTQGIDAICREADIVVVAMGKAKFLTANMVKPGAAVIDVGINRLPDGSLCGDVDYGPVSGVAGWMTPVPGGVGPMTIAMLLSNTVTSAKRAHGLV